MLNIKYLLISALISISLGINAQQVDSIKTSKGNITIHFLGHGSLFFEFNGKNIFIDPYSKVADYTTLPKADLVLITHDHPDHLDSTALSTIITSNTTLYWTKACEKNSKLKLVGKVLNNGDKVIWKGVLIEAVPAYNIINKNKAGNLFHPVGEGNGFILTFGNKRIYIAGDTENIPEMPRFRPISVAFLPMNLPYTMTPEMVKDAALMLDPKILYPYHFGKTDTSTIIDLLKERPSIEVRIRKME